MRVRSSFLFLAALACYGQQDRRTPVLVELFTSQGCSSCPPADQVLARLDAQQPVRGVEIIVLSEHVDYWNRLGWTDPFSSPQFSERQRRYSLQLRADAYTPQMIVNGRVAFVGSDERRARREIESAARATVNPELRVEKSRGNSITIHIAAPDAPRDAVAWLAITESGLSSDVRSGENGGRRLAHTGVVRSLEPVKWESGSAAAAKIAVRLRPEWKTENLRAVVFVQARNSTAILGAASTPLLSTAASSAPVSHGLGGQ